jgi:serine/threonine-protein kinase RsbW
MAAGSQPSVNSDQSGTVLLTIGSRLENLAVVHALIEGLSRQHDLDEETTTALQVAVIEAGTNAIQHGNVFATDKLVFFEFRIFPGEICVWVKDYGKGFDPRKVADPTDESALLDPHGRGLYLMRTMVDDVSFETRPDHGTTVCLKKRCSCSP